MDDVVVEDPNAENCETPAKHNDLAAKLSEAEKGLLIDIEGGLSFEDSEILNRDIELQK